MQHCHNYETKGQNDILIQNNDVKVYHEMQIYSKLLNKQIYDSIIIIISNVKIDKKLKLTS